VGQKIYLERQGVLEVKALVIGAGFAGLSAALRLRQAGLEVWVVDQLLEPGGKAAGWEGVPTGPTVLTMPEIPRRIFASLGATLPPMQSISPLTRYTWPDGRQFAPELDLSQTISQLNPAEAKQYQYLLEQARIMYEDARNTFIFSSPPSLYKLGQYALRHGAKAHPFKTLAQLVESGPYLTPFFLRFATYMGANPYQAPAVLHNIAWVELGLGIYHIPGGMRALVDALVAQAKAMGIGFLWGEKALSMNYIGANVSALQTDKGWHTADYFVSSADRHFTLGWLGLPVPKAALGVSGIAILMHLEEALAVGHQVYFSSNYSEEWAAIALGKPSPEPTMYLHTEGKTAFLLVNAPSGSSIPPGYADMLMERIQKLHPLPVSSYKVLGPADYAQTAYKGALYGRAPKGLVGSLRPGWRIGQFNNLVQVGGTVHPGGGVPLSMLSGWEGAGWLLR
jgi:1-hydroxycarotenoid 3,4-desaturase